MVLCPKCGLFQSIELRTSKPALLHSIPFNMTSFLCRCFKSPLLLNLHYFHEYLPHSHVGAKVNYPDKSIIKPVWEVTHTVIQAIYPRRQVFRPTRIFPYGGSILI